MGLLSALAQRAGDEENIETELSPELKALGVKGQYTEILGTRTFFFPYWPDKCGALV